MHSVFTVYIHVELSFTKSRSPLFIANGLKAEENSHNTTILFHLLENINKICILLYIMCYHTLFHYLYASVICASKSRTSAVLLVLNIGN
jgi:hypothetical protein